MKTDQKLFEEELKIISQAEVLPCLCEEGKTSNADPNIHLENALTGTFIEYALAGNIHKISCMNCDDEVSFNNTDDIVEVWNKSEKRAGKKEVETSETFDNSAKNNIVEESHAQPTAF